MFVFCFKFAKKRDKYSIRVNPNNGLILFFFAFAEHNKTIYTDTHGHINIKNKQWNSEFDLSLMMQNTFERNKILITFEYEEQQQKNKRDMNIKGIKRRRTIIKECP